MADVKQEQVGWRCLRPQALCLQVGGGGRETSNSSRIFHRGFLPHQRGEKAGAHEQGSCCVKKSAGSSVEEEQTAWVLLPPCGGKRGQAGDKGSDGGSSGQIRELLPW